jgi:HD-GYP domain-containing protein (c-di-GMP phosphodiesterase class II)
MDQDTSLTLHRERLFSTLLALAGLSALAFSVLETSWKNLGLEQVLMAVLFTGAVILADHFPVHLTRGTKASMTSLPIYMAAVLLPAPLAILTAGFGLTVAELRTRRDRGLLPRDIASTSGQWMVATFLGSLTYNVNIPWLSDDSSKFITLVACALVFLATDFLIFAISNTYILREDFLQVLRTAVFEGIGIEGAQYIIAILGALVVHEDRWSLPLLVVPVIITYITFKNIKEVRNDTLVMLEDMADTVDLRDIYTGGHSRRVADLAAQILNRLKIFGHEAEIIVTAARLHDIGKIGIPDDILKKPDRLTPEEMLVMQSHSQKGADLISKYKTFSRGVSMIRHHHERWDGHGYPGRLRDYQIPFGARVIAVADGFDAMTSDRPYRRALSEKQAIQILLEGRGKQWDPAIVEAFVDLISEQSSGLLLHDELPEKDPMTVPLLPQKV